MKSILLTFIALFVLLLAVSQARVFGQTNTPAPTQSVPSGAPATGGGSLSR